MKSIYNPSVDIRLSEKERDYITFRRAYYHLDKLIVELYRPARHTVREYNELARQYIDLQTRADRLEHHIRKLYLHPGLDKEIAWMKSFPFEDLQGNPVDTDKI